ncbi:MAG: HlyD family efflux transporter periplasmic adaptor subunit [Acidimicrobiales bacterium]
MTGANRRTDEGGAVRARVAAGVGVVVVVLGLVARATVADTSSGGSYRTATATKATVLQTLTRAGTIEPVAQATIAFPVAGTVATVTVRVGDTVATGQELASLDTTALTGELATRQASLATAQAALDQAVAGQSASTTGSAPASTASSSAAASTRGAARSPGNGTASHELASTQQQVLDGQRQVDAATTAAKAALDAAATACTGPGPDTAAGVTATTLPATEPRTGPRAAAAVSASAQTGLGSAACMTAQQRVLTSQQSLADALHGLSQVESSLDEVLSRAADTAAAATSTGSSSSASSAGSPSGGSSASSQASSNTGSAGQESSSSAPSAAQLVADQAAVDAADAAVSVAQQSIDQATVVSPIAGAVGAVTLVPGHQVTAGSSVADVVVVGQGGSEVATTVSVDDVDKVRIGQTATVVPDGTSMSLDARVVSIGVAGSTSGTTTTYPVVVGFTGSPAGLGNGASASVRIELARADDVLTVPTSAVRTTGTVKTVEVPAGGSTRAVPVQVGTVGPDRTEVTSGLAAGQAVVLADLSRPLPASNTTNTGGGLGGLGGGGIGAGGARIGVRAPG